MFKEGSRLLGYTDLPQFENARPLGPSRIADVKDES